MDKCLLEMSSFLAYWIEKAGARSLSHFARTKERVFAGREFRRSFADTPLSPGKFTSRNLSLYLGQTLVRSSFFSPHPYRLSNPLPSFVFLSRKAKIYILLYPRWYRINYANFGVDRIDFCISWVEYSFERNQVQFLNTSKRNLIYYQS